MKACEGVDVQIHIFLDLGTIWRRVVTFTPRPLYPPLPRGKSSWNSLDRRLGGSQSRSGYVVEFGEIIYAHKILVRIPTSKKQLGRPRSDGRIAVPEQLKMVHT
jgi:hypothetical protein